MLWKALFTNALGAIVLHSLMDFCRGNGGEGEGGGNPLCGHYGGGGYILFRAAVGGTLPNSAQGHHMSCPIQRMPPSKGALSHPAPVRWTCLVNCVPGLTSSLPLSRCAGAHHWLHPDRRRSRAGDWRPGGPTGRRLQPGLSQDVSPARQIHHPVSATHRREQLKSQVPCTEEGVRR